MPIRNLQEKFDDITADYTTSIKPLLKTINELSDRDKLSDNDKMIIGYLLKSLHLSEKVYHDSIKSIVEETIKELGLSDKIKLDNNQSHSNFINYPPGVRGIEKDELGRQILHEKG